MTRQGEREPHLLNNRWGPAIFPTERFPMAYILLDANDRVIDWNSAAERVFGYRKEEVLGRDCISLLVSFPTVDNVREVVCRTWSTDRLGNIDDAKKRFNEVIELQQNARAKDPTLGQSWVVWLEVDILRHEAEALLNGKSITTAQLNIEQK